MGIPTEKFKIPAPSQQARQGRGTHGIPFDPEFIPGAYNAVNVCLRVQPHEQVCVITDEATLEIAAAIVAEVEKLGAPYHAWVLEDLAERPLKNLAREILDDLAASQVSIFAVQAQQNELRSRIQMTDVVNRQKIRHAHMVNINRQIMLEGMRADFQRVDRLSQKVVEMVRRASKIRAKTAAGTDLTANLNPNYKWLKTSGIISAEKWGNLPGGEIFTTPGEVNGTFVIDGVVGDYLCAKFGSLEENPLTVRMKRNRLTEAHSENRDLENDFWNYTHTDENSDRVGEFAIGTNIDLKDVIGQILQDEKYPGVHIAFGNPYGAHTGADWDSTTHIDVVGRKFNIWVDEKQIMSEGKFLVEGRAASVMSGAYKFGHLSASGDEEPFRYTDCYAVEKTTGPSRLVIAPAAGHVKLMRELTIAMRQPLGLLYVLVVPRGEGEAGRYQSPAPVSSDELQAFLSQFGEFLEKDARHHLWIMSTDSSSILVYDNHNVIYAYGPLDAFERILLAQGLARAENVVFPVPHMHRYNVEFDEQAKSLLSYWNWIHFPLQESDDR